MTSEYIFLLSLLYCFVLFETNANPNVFLEKCEQSCLDRKDTCGVICQKKSLRRKRFRLERCLDKCSSDSRMCTSECSCNRQCKSEFQDCKHSCESHPSLGSTWNIEQCVRECQFENGQCKHECQVKPLCISMKQENDRILRSVYCIFEMTNLC